MLFSLPTHHGFRGFLLGKYMDGALWVDLGRAMKPFSSA